MIFRIFRAVKFLKDLKTMLVSVISSFVAMIWAFVLLALVLFIAALMFIQLQASFLIELRLKDELDTVPVEIIDKMFGSVFTGMLTLFMATTGGDDWINVWDVVSFEQAGMSQVALVGFIFFWHFSMMNVVTGVVMEKAVRNAQPDRDELMMKQRRDDEITCQELSKLFKEMDSDGSGTLTMVEFVECLKVDEIASYFGTIGLSISDAEYFFSMLCETVGSDVIYVEDFIQQCSHMKGQALSLDVIQVAWELQGIRRILESMPGVDDKFRKPRHLPRSSPMRHNVSTQMSE
eukprot:TRINITY_DN33825_c0_g1_i1.p1 TRINITY_DN33825_c0_g1~~TRINITY_DN33825_c0_g1_i1.p1  ORF type:complete len:291 (+),score=51.80 TRINITY_DN33825_c0_g1_i1:3-875(+)